MAIRSTNKKGWVGIASLTTCFNFSWQAGKTVVTTIHQPSSRLFHKFDKLILLGKGSLLYFGKAAEAMVYFSSIGCSPLIAMNPAEFLLDLANGNINDVSIPSELEDKVQMENSERETRNGKPSPAVVHEVKSQLNYILYRDG